ncbi:Uncharacterised protein [Enterobacter cloacae]|uniref:Uncharacterized protein n=1 Tax=Enterobacter cloacae TaxID=550 RepID=A0A377M9U4_ENTCL|nr:Uncharacterised protein [Enterobacter cloacae]
MKGRNADTICDSIKVLTSEFNACSLRHPEFSDILTKIHRIRSCKSPDTIKVQFTAEYSQQL